MCGRAYHTYTDEELAIRYLNRKAPLLPGLEPNFNLCPTQLAPVVRVIEGEIRMDGLRWGLVPPWAKDGKTTYSMINARGEEIETKPAFRSAFKRQRCVVPFTGFFEWKREGESKRPFAIYLKDRSIMSVAGIWESCTTSQGEIIESFAVVTIGPNELMKDIHDRMPVILDDEGVAAWLDERNNEKVAALKAWIRPCPAEWLACHEVSKLVNSPKNNRPEVLDPASA